jgi:hypothetical protein
MPYSLEKVGKKYYVVDTSGRRYSKKPLSLAKAKKQMTALHINTGHGLTASCLKSLFTTEYEEPETPQMVTRGFTEDDDVISRTEYPSALVVPRKKKSTLKKILNYIKETDEKDFGDTFKTYKNPTYGKGKRKCKGGSYETTLPLLEKSLKEIIETMEYKLSRTPFQYLTNFLDKILKELNELIDEKGELPKLREFGLNFIRKLHPPERLLELMHPEALELQRELPSYIPSDYELEQLNSDGLRLRRTVSPFLFLGPNRNIEDRRHKHGEETRKPPPSRSYTDSDIIIPESEMDRPYTRMMPKEMYMDYIRGVGPPINTDPRNVKYLVSGLIPHSARDYWMNAPDRPPQPKGKPREKRYGRPSPKEGKGKHTEEDTHILIGDELSGCGRKDTLREEYELIMRRPNLTQQAKDDLVRIYQAGLHKLNQKGKSKILGILTNSKIAKEKDDILRNTIDLMHRRVPIQLIQRSRFSTELTPEQMSENLATSFLNEYAEQEVDDPRNYIKEGEGKLKFVKKYLKGQGIPATKKNVSKICNIMDVEGVVFE